MFIYIYLLTAIRVKQDFHDHNAFRANSPKYEICKYQIEIDFFLCMVRHNSPKSQKYLKMMNFHIKWHKCIKFKIILPKKIIKISIFSRLLTLSWVHGERFWYRTPKSISENWLSHTLTWKIAEFMYILVPALALRQAQCGNCSLTVASPYYKANRLLAHILKV